MKYAAAGLLMFSNVGLGLAWLTVAIAGRRRV